MSYKNALYNAPCEINKPKLDFNFLIKQEYMTKEEVAIYKAAEKNGFDVSITTYSDIHRNGDMIEKFKIEIVKTKIF